MNDFNFAITRTFKLSKRISVTMTAGLGGFCCEWYPTLRKLKPGELAAYRNARDALLNELSEKLGGKIVCIEV